MNEVATLRILTQPTPYRLPEPLWIGLQLTNTGARSIDFGVSTPAGDFALDLQLRGEPVARTEFGENALSPTIRKMSSRTLDAGESYTADLDLAEVFVIDEAGRYQLRAAKTVNLLDDGRRVQVVSAPAVLDVVST